MKEIPISKIYEALSAIADKRVKKIDENQYLVISSDKSKAYTVILDGKIASSNDNATYWQHYAGYPILACYLYEGKLDDDKKTAFILRKHTMEKTERRKQEQL